MTSLLPKIRLALAWRIPLATFSIAIFFAGTCSLLARAAGQSPSSSMLTITPTAVTLLVGESWSLSAVDATGRPASAAQWSIEPPIADLHVENGEVQIEAKASGRATLTAVSDTRSASATISILPGQSLPAGTVRWSLQPMPGFETLFVRQAVPTGDSSVDFYSIEWSRSANAIVRALGESGQQLWMVRLTSLANPQTLRHELPEVGVTRVNQQQINSFHDLLPNDPHFPAPSEPTARLSASPMADRFMLVHDSGDDFGGILLLERGGLRDSLVDLNPADGHESWRYRSEGRLNKNWTVNHNGDIGLVELRGQSPFASFIVIDGKTGTLLFRIPFPDSSTTIKGFRCKDPVYNVLTNTRRAGFGSVFTSTDSNMYIQVSTHIELSDNENCKPKQYSVDDTLALLRVTPDGQSEWKTFEHVHADGDGGYHVQPRAFPGESIPDGFGGVLAAWTWVDPHKGPGDPLNIHVEARLTRLSDSDQRDFTLPLPFWTKGINSFFAENMVLAEGNQLYAVNGPQLIRFDTETGNVDWLRHPPTGDVKLQHSTAGGGVLVANAGRLVYFDAHGNGASIPWTVAVPNSQDIGLVQTDPFDHTPLAPLQIRDVQMCWRGNFLAVEDGTPYGQGALLLFIAH